MNWVLILTRNNLALTQRCVESVRHQSLETSVFIVDNGSTDGTQEWVPDHANSFFICQYNAGVSRGWNMGLKYIFEEFGAEYALVIGNDTVLPAYFYGALLGYPSPFTTGVAVERMEDLYPAPNWFPVPHPDFSAFLIKRECWKKVGKFDESMKNHASDCDYHVRGYRAGVEMMKAPVPFYHIASQTLKRALPFERVQIEAQAHQDRKMFFQKYGVVVGTPGYDKLFEKNEPVSL